jgi:hypothetical protein
VRKRARRVTAVEAADHSSAQVFTGRAAEHLRDKDMEIESLKPDAERGRRFHGNKRHENRLYREARAVLEREGRERPASFVRSALKRNGIVQVKDDSLIWTDGRGKPKKTRIHQFDSRLGAIRKRLL